MDKTTFRSIVTTIEPDITLQTVPFGGHKTISPAERPTLTLR